GLRGEEVVEKAPLKVQSRVGHRSPYDPWGTIGVPQFIHHCRVIELYPTLRPMSSVYVSCASALPAGRRPRSPGSRRADARSGALPRVPTTCVVRDLASGLCPSRSPPRGRLPPWNLRS